MNKTKTGYYCENCGRFGIDSFYLLKDYPVDLACAVLCDNCFDLLMQRFQISSCESCLCSSYHLISYPSDSAVLDQKRFCFGCNFVKENNDEIELIEIKTKKKIERDLKDLQNLLDRTVKKYKVKI